MTGGMTGTAGTTAGRRGSLRQVVMVGVAAAVLTACAAKRDSYEVPDIAMPDTLRNRPAVEPGVDTFRATSEHLEKVLPRWWTALDSAELDGLVERALRDNMDLRMAVLRVVQTRARLGQIEADGWPVLSATVSTGQESPANGLGTVPVGQSPTSQRTYEAGLRLDWRPDLWGEYAAADESAANQLRAAIHARDSVRAQVIADTVRVYLQYLSLQDRLTTARDVTRIMSDTLHRLQQQQQARDATALRVAQQRATTFASIAAIPDLELQTEGAFNRLAILVGALPGNLELQATTLGSVTIPAVPDALEPKFLLGRPDVRQAEAQLLGADADIDVARARVLPPLSLRAGVGWGSHYLARLLSPESLMWEIAGELVATLFDAGKRGYAVDQSRARHAELTVGYVRAVYEAVREVEEALAAQVHLTRRVAAQETAVDASRQAYDLSIESYNFGAVDYLTLLDAERTYLRNQDDLHQIRLSRLQSVADLMQALGAGAGFIPEDPPSPAEDAPPLHPAEIAGGEAS